MVGGGGEGGAGGLLLAAGGREVAELALATTAAAGALMRLVDRSEITADTALSAGNTGLKGGEQERREPVHHLHVED